MTRSDTLADAPLIIVVGSGGVGKTTLAAALGLRSAAAGDDTLVMTFDPSWRLKDTLGIRDRVPARPSRTGSGTAESPEQSPEESTAEGAAMADETEVGSATPGRLAASLLDARRTFDRLIDRYSPDARAARRIHENRFYDHLSGTLAGVLEYMAVERLYEVWASGRYQRIVLDTPPTREALDFLQAPERLVSFLDSGALRIALKQWFDESGHLRATSRIKLIGRNVEAFLDRLVGLELLRDMAEFFQAFAPLYDGFRERALEVQELLRSSDAQFVLVSGPGTERVADTMFFARRLTQAGHRLGAVVVNRVHPPVDHGQGGGAATDDGRALLSWLARRDREGVAELRSLLGREVPLVDLPLLPDEPTGLEALDALGQQLEEALGTHDPAD